MSIPFHLDEAQVPWTHYEEVGLVDVETGGIGIIARLRSLLVTTLGWSEPSTALFKTPVDAAGRFLDVLLTRISATNLEWRVRNAAAATICTRRIQIDAAGTTVRYFANIFGVCVESLRATSEIAQAHVLDQTPDLQSDGTLYVVGSGYRSNADVDTATNDAPGEYFAIDNGAAGSQARFRRYTNGAGTAINQFTATGLAYIGDTMVGINHAGTMTWAGRVCHALLLPTQVGPGCIRRPKIDTNIAACFQTVGLTAANNQRLAFRRTEVAA